MHHHAIFTFWYRLRTGQAATQADVRSGYRPAVKRPLFMWIDVFIQRINWRWRRSDRLQWLKLLHAIAQPRRPMRLSLFTKNARLMLRIPFYRQYNVSKLTVDISGARRQFSSAPYQQAYRPRRFALALPFREPRFAITRKSSGTLVVTFCPRSSTSPVPLKTLTRSFSLMPFFCAEEGWI